jgi:hypothetical protein
MAAKLETQTVKGANRWRRLRADQRFLAFRSRFELPVFEDGYGRKMMRAYLLLVLMLMAVFLVLFLDTINLSRTSINKQSRLPPS